MVLIILYIQSFWASMALEFFFSCIIWYTTYICFLVHYFAFCHVIYGHAGLMIDD